VLSAGRIFRVFAVRQVKKLCIALELHPGRNDFICGHDFCCHCLERSFGGQLCQEYSYQRLLISDNPSSRYNRKCQGSFLGHSKG